MQAMLFLFCAVTCIQQPLPLASRVLKKVCTFCAGVAEDFNEVSKAEVAAEMSSTPLSQLEQTVLLMAAPENVEQ